MSIYFEAPVSKGLDHIIELVPVLILMFVVLKYPVVSQIFEDITKIKRVVLVRIFTILMILFSIDSITDFAEIIRLKNIIAEKSFSQVKGCIVEYRRESPKSGVVIESFKVNNVVFNVTSYEGGPYFSSRLHSDSFLTNGKCVSINYVEIGSNNKIIRISS